jgi:hypothetical protein
VLQNMVQDIIHEDNKLTTRDKLSKDLEDRTAASSCMHQPRGFLVVVERNLFLRRALKDLIHKEGRTSEWNACRRQVGS